MTRLSPLFFLVITALLVGCVQVTQEYPVRSTPLAVSSARDLPIVYPAGSQFALAPKYLKKVSLKPDEVKAVYRLYSNEIVNNFQARGYVLTTSPKDADFLVGFGIALSEDLSDELIDEKFGVTPGLAEDGVHRKGSLLIYVNDAITANRVWRGTAQGFAQENVDIEERKTRISHIIETLLLQFHEKG